MSEAKQASGAKSAGPAEPGREARPGLSGRMLASIERLWPRTLYARLLGAAILGVGVSLAVMMATLSLRMDQSVRVAMNESMAALAAGIADDVSRAGREAVPAPGPELLSSLLSRYRLISGVDRIAVITDDGTVVGAHAFAVAARDLSNVPTPPSLRQSVVNGIGPPLIARVLGDDRPVKLVFWEPIGWRGFSGWVMVERNVSDLGAAQVDVVRLMGLQALLATIVLAYVLMHLLRPALDQLRRASEFAANMGHAAGARLELEPASFELDMLRDALNRAARDVALLTRDAAMLRQRHDALIEASVDAVMVLNAQGVLTEVNAAAQALYGYNAEELRGTSAERLVPPSHLDSYRAVFTHFWASGELPFTGRRLRVRGLRRDGSVFPGEMTVCPVGTDADMMIIATVRDCTQSEADARQLKLAKEAAEDVASARSLLVAQLGHEVRTPLNGLVGTTELALATEPTPVQREYLEAARTCARQLSRVVDDLLDVSRIEAGRLVVEEIAYSPRRLVDELAASHQGLARQRGLRFEARCASEVPALVVGDPTRVRQVLDNLLSNAVKFTREGMVRLECRPDVSGDKESALVFSVIDTGPGIDAAQRERIFDAFEQGGSAIFRRHGGSGLGLGLARELAVLMHGLLWLDSRPGAGTTFHLTLPLVEANAQQQAIADASREDESRGSRTLAASFGALRVLVADDNPINRLIMLRALQAEGCRVDALADGQQADKAWRAHAYDLALIDLSMPIVDGFALLHEFQDARSAGPRPRRIVAMSASGDPADRARALSAGADLFIAKPIEPSALIGQLLVLLRQEPECADTDRVRARPAMKAHRPAGAVASTAASAPAIDPSFVRESIGQDETLYARLLGMAADQLPRARCMVLREGRGAQGAAMAGALHELANALGVIGARHAAGLARECEIRCRREQPIDRQALDTLVAAVIRSERAIAAEREMLAAAQSSQERASHRV